MARKTVRYWLTVRVVAWLCVALCACIRSSSVTCASGRVCPEGTTCAHVTEPDEDLCAQPGQLAACANQPDYTHCGSDARCYAGVCLPTECGNGRVDRADPNDPSDVGEVCDDGNQKSGDGCSSDCRSDETCGNGVIDPINAERCDDGNAIQHDGCDSRCQPEIPQWRLQELEPGPRGNAALAYDSDRRVVVLFGGADLDIGPNGGAAFGDTWEWNGFGWKHMHPAQSPEARSHHAMAYDAARHRVVMFGGNSADAEFRADTWEWDGTTWTPRFVATAPHERHSHAMAYDAKRQRVVLFGGLAVLGGGKIQGLGDTWEWDGTTWSQIMFSGATPPARGAPAMAYDPSRAKTVMFGGVGGLADTWEYEGTTWTPRVVVGPAGRETAMAYDPINHDVAIYGGASGTTVFGDAWAWNGVAWTKLPGTAPPARSGNALAGDVAHGTIISVGGNPTNEVGTWVFYGFDWMHRSTQPTYAQRAGSQCAMAREPLSGRDILFGTCGAFELIDSAWLPIASDPGTTAAPIENRIVFDEARDVALLYQPYGRQTWTWDTEFWTQLQPAAAPAQRAGVAFAWDGVTRQVVLFGGSKVGAGGDWADTWAWNGTTWRLLTTSHAPPARTAAVFAWDPVRREAILFGGSASATATTLSDTWAWNGSDWIERTPSATSPPPRSNAAFAWNPSRQRLLLFGGVDTSGPRGDTWEWDGASWQQVLVANAPGERFNAVMATSSDGTGIVLVGGQNSINGSFADLWSLRWEGSDTDEVCAAPIDADGDQLAVCSDPDCWTTCSPLCPPGATCDPAAPHCGDGTCMPGETCHSCPSDCTTCKPACGDGFCDTGETATCPGDCP